MRVLPNKNHDDDDDEDYDYYHTTIIHKPVTQGWFHCLELLYSQDFA